MKPAPFTLHRARSIGEAVGLLAALSTDGAEVKVLAGGQSLVPLLNFRLARPDHIVDVGEIDELRTIAVADGSLRIGAMARQDEVAAAEVVQRELPLLAEAIGHIGHGPIRRRGTIGGSIAHADPAAELPAVAVALDATVTVVGPEGQRSIPAGELFAGWFSTALADDELLTEIAIPLPAATTESGFAELARRPGDFATVLAATIVRRGEDGTVTDARIVLGGVGATPVRSTAAEQALIGSAGDEGPIAAAAEAARASCDPVADVQATADYRKAMIEVLVRRALVGLRASGGSIVDRAGQRPATPGPGGETVVRLNGSDVALDGVADRLLLADWVRDHHGLTGTHLGCEHGVCGACTVLLDGEPVRSCLLFARQAGGHEVTTIEALGSPDNLHPVQEAFRAHHGLQCGFCTPGMVLATVDLLERRAAAGAGPPSEVEIRSELSGNICRCTGYVKIVEAVAAAATAWPREEQP